ncbi:MAG: S53 family peptidase [Thermoplasmata archaeon]|jgi:subtilase family serine protease|nr:S53 family peptidase [Thermoplasmata archaeon]
MDHKKIFAIVVVISLLVPFTIFLSYNVTATPFSKVLAKQSSPQGYSPQQMQSAYSVNTLITQGYDGSGTTIVIVDAYGSSSITNDVNYFDNYFGLPQIKLNVYYPEGKVNAKNTGWAQETTLDVEWAHAIAPGATIDLVVVKSASFTDLYNGLQYAVGLANSTNVVAISMSFGAAESQTSTTILNQWDQLFSYAVSKGITPIASSGDNGAYDGTSSLTVDFPASDPNVLSVGGTTLTITNNVWNGETTWSGSGGGSSSYFSEPSYQKSVSLITNNYRGVPDVAYDANPNTGVSVYYSGSWYVFGGTSIGAPQWAGLIAIAAQIQGHGLGLVQSTIYSLASSNSYSQYFHDIVSGPSNGYYNAQVGWDYVTGWGSPIASALVPKL